MTPLYLYLLRTSIDPVQQSTDGVKGQRLYILQVLLHHNFLTRAAIQTQPLQERGDRQGDNLGEKYWKQSTQHTNTTTVNPA